MTRARELYVTRTVARILRERPEVIQSDLASALGCDRTRIAHMLSGRQVLPADELDVVCDVIGTIEPLDAIARRIGHHVVPIEREAATVTIERGAWELLHAVSGFGRDLAGALADGRLDAAERSTLRRQLFAAREVLDGLIAKMPEVTER